MKENKMTAEKIECKICGAECHFIEAHLKDAGHDVTVEEYASKYPTAPLMSQVGEAKLAEFAKLNSANKKDFDIKATFGVAINDKITTVKGFENPQSTTPDIDPDYVFAKEILAVVIYALANKKERVLLTGATGSGKSSVIEQVAARLNYGCRRVNFDGDITRADLIGQWTLKGEEMVFQYGVLPKAMIEGAIFLMDEWDSISPSVAMLLQPVLEGKGLVITETGETIRPHEDFRIFATSNTIGQGDTTGLYNGTQPQNFAQLDRFSLVGIVDYPNKPTERKIIKKKCGLDDATIIDQILEVAELIRKAHVKGETMATMSTRTVVNVADKLMNFGDVKLAYSFAFVNKLNEGDRAFVNEIVQRVFGGK